jgi:hypothetical protein
MKRTKFDDLLAGEVCSLSLINEPLVSEDEEKSYSAEALARKRWRMIKREVREKG